MGSIYDVAAGAMQPSSHRYRGAALAGTLELPCKGAEQVTASHGRHRLTLPCVRSAARSFVKRTPRWTWRHCLHRIWSLQEGSRQQGARVRLLLIFGAPGVARDVSRTRPLGVLNGHGCFRNATWKYLVMVCPCTARHLRKSRASLVFTTP